MCVSARSSNKQKDNCGSQLRCSISLPNTCGMWLSSSSSSSSWEGLESCKGSKLCGDGAVSATMSKFEVKALMLMRLLEAEELLEYAGCSTAMFCRCCCCCEFWREFANANLLFISCVCTMASSACRDATWIYNNSFSLFKPFQNNILKLT